ncbi:hypothetical protein CC85DRAFT_286241 [Cutaneotrichosporon oleaginosum]|uniref:Uncharacterized protein n=1 Tax=Cutaneotrichosporon oleaginosum TaxID=879819 RepID=A0A0J0XKV0_9TREE|nr:uncharacterized protein CC85DRAFT_286241 [Cutaneotrichosporon oleaginosum]KLT41705.1 hypothetical protein CC85DRAFT_286241 [Cutaneotrichosporon oleaginosum]TXT08077.1 hypothetical protein COLE_05001 [Cutaneotrichosporon oleaginosum]
MRRLAILRQVATFLAAIIAPLAPPVDSASPFAPSAQPAPTDVVGSLLHSPTLSAVSSTLLSTPHDFESVAPPRPPHNFSMCATARATPPPSTPRSSLPRHQQVRREGSCTVAVAWSWGEKARRP